jgi:lipooligosaccharide transport system ATP-binding protein
MTAETVVIAKDIYKNFGSIRAVDGVSFQVMLRECYGFLGPNGAGKTTTIRMIYCHTPLTSGVLNLFGLDSREHRRKIKAIIGVAPQENNLRI